MIKPKKEKKKQAALRGSLLIPLSIGCPAVFTAGGTVYRTSEVEKIHRMTADEAYFETKNTCYRIFLEPFPLAAVIPMRNAVIPMGNALSPIGNAVTPMRNAMCA